MEPSLPQPEPTDAEILDWIQRNTTPDFWISCAPLLKEYEVYVQYADGERLGPWTGATLRAAFIMTMKHFDRPLYIPTALLPDPPLGMTDIMDNALTLDAKYLPKKD